MERSHARIPSSLHDIKYRGGCGGESAVVGSLWTRGGAARDGLGGERAEPSLLHGLLEDIGKVPHLSTGRHGNDSGYIPTGKLEKTKVLVYTTGYIWLKWSKAAYKRRDTGDGQHSGGGSGQG